MTDEAATSPGRGAGVMGRLAAGEAHDPPGAAALAPGALIQPPAIMTYSAFRRALIGCPPARMSAASTRIHDLAGAARARRRAHGRRAGAGGFADTLGAGISGALS